MSEERNPWSVRGVSREARAKAAKAARRRHMTMGEWVDYVLTSSANAELSSRPPSSGASPEAGGPAPEAPAGALPANIEGIERRLVSIESREKELLALVERVASHRGVEAADPELGQEVARLRTMGEVIQGLVGRIEAYLRPLAQVPALIRRIEEGETRQRQILLVLERLAEHEVGRKREHEALAAAVARIERRIEGGERGAGEPRRAEEPRRWAPPTLERPQADAAPRFDFTMLQERAIANSRRFGQREPDERRGLFGRRRSTT